MMDSVHVNCPHCHKAVTVTVTDFPGRYATRMVIAGPGPSTMTSTQRGDDDDE